MLNVENEYFNEIVDKIDYDNIITYINSIKSEYNIFKTDKFVFSKYYDDVYIVLDVFLNKNCELYCESKIILDSENDIKTNKDNSAFLFTKKFGIKNKNTISSYLKGNITEYQLICNIKQSFNDKLNNIRIKTKLELLNNKIYLYSLNHWPKKYLSYLLKKEYLFNNFCDNLVDISDQNVAFNIIGPEFILKCDHVQINNIFNKIKTYQLDNFTIIYFNKLKEQLFINIEKILLKQNNKNLSKKQYLLILFGLYFKLFNNKEILKITSLFDLMHIDLYKQYVFNFNSDFKFSFINSLFEKNSINYKLPNNQYCDIVVKNGNKKFSYNNVYNKKINYLIELSKMILKKETYFLGTKKDYKNIKDDLCDLSTILSTLLNINKLMFLEKINTNFKHQ
jgi:hypothetical protein